MVTLDDLREDFCELVRQTENLVDKLKNFSLDNDVRNESEEKLQKARDILGSVMNTIEFAGSQLDED